MAFVGSVAHFYYHFHLAKFNGKKTVLTKEIARLGDDILEMNRQLKTLDSSNLTTYNVSFKIIGKSIRGEKSTAVEVVGADTLFRLCAGKRMVSKASSITDSSTAKRRKKTTLHDEQSESDGVMEDDNQASKWNSVTIPRRRKLDDESRSNEGIKEEEAGEVDDPGHDCRSRKRKAFSRPCESSTNLSKPSDKTSNTHEWWSNICENLTQKVEGMKSKIISQRSKIVELKRIIESEQTEIESLKKELSQFKDVQGNRIHENQ